MMKHLVLLSIAASFVALATASPATAQTTATNRTILSFPQPVEVPGKVLPAGTYTFELHDSGMNRHVIQIFDATGSKLVALVLAIPDYRLKATDNTVIKFNEVQPGQPQAIRAWFYPGQTVGQELVYSKSRARELAAASNLVVPAIDDTLYVDSSIDTMKTADVVAITPEKEEKPVTMIQMTPEQHAAMMQANAATPTPVVQPTPTPAGRKALPRTAGTLPIVMFVGAGLLALGLALRKVKTAKAAR